MTEDVEALIRSYELAVTEGLGDDEGCETESIVALLRRDTLAERWSNLTPEQKTRVGRLDDLLVEKRARVAEVLPNAAVTDRRQWWWFLNEGPQVRQEAQEAA